MTIYSDTTGNVFLGDVIYSGGTNQLVAEPISGVSTELISLCQTAGLQLRATPTQSIPSQSLFNSGTATYMAFSPSGDSTIGRYMFVGIGSVNGGSQDSGSPSNQVVMFNNGGCTSTDPGSSAGGTTWLTIARNAQISGVGWTGLASSLSNSFYAGVATSNSMGLIHFRYEGSGLQLRFWYAGRLANVNPNYSYYNTSLETDSVLFTNNTTTGGTVLLSTGIGGVHRIAGTRKLLLQTGDAQYPIVCSDGQSPTAQWATDMYVFDNNATLGYPAIGRVRNLLLAQGTYNITKPVKIQGTAMPDNGFNAWLPVGTFAGKTVLMRCYSSALV